MVRFSLGGQLNPKNAPEVQLEDGRTLEDSLLEELHALSVAQVKVVRSRYEAHAVVGGESSQDSDADRGYEK